VISDPTTLQATPGASAPLLPQALVVTTQNLRVLRNLAMALQPFRLGKQHLHPLSGKPPAHLGTLPRGAPAIADSTMLQATPRVSALRPPQALVVTMQLRVLKKRAIALQMFHLGQPHLHPLTGKPPAHLATLPRGALVISDPTTLQVARGASALRPP